MTEPLHTKQEDISQNYMSDFTTSRGIGYLYEENQEAGHEHKSSIQFMSAPFNFSLQGMDWICR